MVYAPSAPLNPTPPLPLCTPTLLITPNGLTTSNAVLSAGSSPTSSRTRSAPLPKVAFLTSSATSTSLKLRGMAPTASLARLRREGTLSTAKILASVCESREERATRAHRPTGPQPITTAVGGTSRLDGRRDTALRAAKYYICANRPESEVSTRWSKLGRTIAKGTIRKTYASLRGF
ncbi:hypothetical protein MPH_06972 [Macrophomina phaseolina MS6]|uniref:Uncharacterized protein n=1 Tax=Macrophomina phaseolina (strain MS6) TaxID=1126212 RepID=K2RM68_MACPH|nr:hypothetical protein MPH_06972 [Macrophomina phaseolina MS6]